MTTAQQTGAEQPCVSSDIGPHTAPSSISPCKHPRARAGGQHSVPAPSSLPQFLGASLLPGVTGARVLPARCLTFTIIYAAELDTFQTSYYTTVCSNTNICSVVQQQFFWEDFSVTQIAEKNAFPCPPQCPPRCPPHLPHGARAHGAAKHASPASLYEISQRE